MDSCDALADFLAASRDAVPALLAEVIALREALSEAIDLGEEANGDPSQCSYSVPIGDRLIELRKAVAS